MSSIRIERSDDGNGVDDEVDIWLDTDTGENNGIVIGCGATVAEACTDAIRDLEDVLRRLYVQALDERYRAAS